MRFGDLEIGEEFIMKPNERELERGISFWLFRKMRPVTLPQLDGPPREVFNAVLLARGKVELFPPDEEIIRVTSHES